MKTIPDVKGGGPKWMALIRRNDKQIMVAFVGHGEPALAMVRRFLKAAERTIPRSDLLIAELNAELDVRQAVDIRYELERFEIRRASEELAMIYGDPNEKPPGRS